MEFLADMFIVLSGAVAVIILAVAIVMAVAMVDNQVVELFDGMKDDDFFKKIEEFRNDFA